MMNEEERLLPARFGSLGPGMLADLVNLRNFFASRDRVLETLFERKLPRSMLRDELTRMIVIEFGFDRVRSVGYYRRNCAHLGRPFEVRVELRTLAEAGLVVHARGTGRRLGSHIYPTQKLIDWYSYHMPSLMNEVMRYLSARGDLSSA